MDGEWNTLRSKGNSRPLSILQIRSDAHAKYSYMKQAKLIGMLTPICKLILEIHYCNNLCFTLKEYLCKYVYYMITCFTTNSTL